MIFFPSSIVFGLASAFFLLFFPPSAEAAEEHTKNRPTISLLPKVTVIGSFETIVNGQSLLDRETIERIPARNGSLNEIIAILPGVHLGEGASSSRTAGEIIPPNLSISGGKIYENNFLIDGLGNNSLLDPTFTLQSNIDNVPGHPQEFFADAELLEQVTVYRSNVPARYGRFTGGVVDATTRRPSDVIGIKASYRTTRSGWTRFHVDEERLAGFRSSSSETDQPRFKKEEIRQTIDLPLTKKSGLLFHHSLLRSRIPLDHLGEEETQQRSLRNVLLKVSAVPSPETEWDLNALWTPYKSDYFLKDVRGSRYTVEGGAVGVSTSIKKYFPLGLIEVDGGYRRSVNSREAPADFFLWLNAFREGGYGDVEKKQTTLTLSTHLTAEPLYTGSVSHALGAGFAYERSAGTYNRLETATRYTNSAVNDGVACEEADPSCITGERFMIFKNIYEADSAKASIAFSEAYIEDVMTFGRLTLRPGLHLSRNTLMENTDLAYRLATALDLFGDGRTILSAGVNRYYGKTFLTHALAEQKKPFTVWTRSAELGEDGRPQSWEQRSRTSIPVVRLVEFDTPYSNEVTAGIDQAVLGGRLHLLFIARRGHDELTRRVLSRDPDGYVHAEWTNEGKTRHKEVSLSWERFWLRHHVLLNGSWQETRTSHLNYTDVFGGDDAVDPIWYKGEVLERSLVLAPDYNRTWTANALLGINLPFGFSFTNVTRYRSGYRVLENTREEIVLPDDRTLKIYEEVKKSESWIFDWKIAKILQLPLPGAMAMNVEVYNVFNAKKPVGVTNDYELGRQFWAGAEYRF